MQLVQFWKEGRVALGIQTAQGVVDVAAEGLRRGLSAPPTMLEAIQGGTEARKLLEALSEQATCFSTAPTAPVLTGMQRILCIGLNYRRHAAECGKQVPNAPAVFCKFSNALAADGDCIRLDPAYHAYDYEAELVAVIGKAGRNIAEEEALDYVFGYTCGNDLSTRDLQFARGEQWLMGKTSDGFAPIGPCLVTADSLNASDLAISCTVNDALRQNSRTSDLIFTVAQIIADLSRHFTLEPGDIIFTGTPEGVMQGYPADQKNWLKPGDRVSVTIEGIGTLHNTFC